MVHLTTLYFSELYANTKNPNETTKRFWRGIVLNFLFRKVGEDEKLDKDKQK